MKLLYHRPMSWVVYILECADQSLYTGITNDLGGRMAAHNAGKGAKYTKGRGPFTLIYQEDCPSRSDASRREMAIKRLTRQGKLELCAGAGCLPAIHRRTI